MFRVFFGFWFFFSLRFCEFDFRDYKQFNNKRIVVAENNEMQWSTIQL